ncbi:MAG: TauD/TfdA family dioxygenase [Candidatus Tectomicrobia bacterium]|nr:TauD/TfdA family dioxygenase [Candidatus Tectomicrobia bacterium]
MPNLTPQPQSAAPLIPPASQPLPFQVRGLSGIMGAEVLGLDLAQPIDDATRDAIYDAFLTHQALVFRKQNLSKAQQVEFTKRFGPLEAHIDSNRGADIPEVHIVSNLGSDGKPSGKMGATAWHTDKSYRTAPSLATLLHAIHTPPAGGETCFANMYAAYEALPAARQAELAELRVVHSWELSRIKAGGSLATEAEIRSAPPVSHPLVRTHPDTGRKCLYMGEHACYIEGRPMEEGQALLQELEAYATQPRFVFQHQWQDGDLLMWDNRCLLHRAASNFDVGRIPRVLHRTCLRGAPTF